MVPVVNDPDCSPLAAMLSRGLSVADIARKTGYSEGHIRRVFKAKEDRNRAYLAGASREEIRKAVPKNKTASHLAMRKIVRAIDPELTTSIFLDLPKRSALVTGRTTAPDLPVTAGQISPTPSSGATPQPSPHAAKEKG